MDRLAERVRLARKALATLDRALAEPKTEMNRDASIQRFEYSYEALWKAAQAFLSTAEKIQLGSPGAVARASFQAGLLTEEQARAALQMAQDRNLTVHTNNEELAEEIYARLPLHFVLMNTWLGVIEARL
jgi:nucleotidyltransferase substrate binding protein (TIGR01987 family)